MFITWADCRAPLERHGDAVPCLLSNANAGGLIPGKPLVGANAGRLIRLPGR